MKRLDCVLLGVGLLGLLVGVSFHGVAATQKSETLDTLPARAFRITYIERYVSKSGEETLRAMGVRDVNVDGTWTETRTSLKTTKQQITTNTDGIIRTVIPDKPDFKDEHALGRAVPSPEGWANVRQVFRSRKFYENHPYVVGTIDILGLKGYRIHTQLKDGGLLEQVYAPETGYCLLRLIDYGKNGGQVQIEATKLEFKD